MDRLPDELITHILDYLEVIDLVNLQGTSRRFLKLARDGPLWRFQCYYDSPKSTLNRIGQKSWSQALAQSLVGGQQHSTGETRMSNKARATDEWDLSDPSERIDWYSEYIARHAQLSVSWLSPEQSWYEVIRGLALFDDSDGKKLIGPLEDGSISVWNLRQQDREPSRHFRIASEPARSLPGILFDDTTAKGKQHQSDKKRSLSFSGVADCVSVDATRQSAYIAVGDLLNEIDLNTLQMISQSKYSWPITALSQIQTPHQPLTLGTSFSLHILDPRSPPRDMSSSASGSERTDPANPTAYFFNKSHDLKLDSTRTTPSPFPPNQNQNPRTLHSYAQLEPAPLSILHQTPHSIMVAGRFPSILNYDRRYFPRLEHVIHSSARLSALAYLPFSPRSMPHSPPSSSTSTGARGTLISCGEYNGRGSLELYSIPHHDGDIESDPYPDAAGVGSTTPEVFAYKNRQSISPSKLLSVTTTGTRIVFSDADGGIKWVERDGRSVVRRWNVNSYQLYKDAFPKVKSRGRQGRAGGLVEAGLHGEEVIRKIIPTADGEAGDLLVWSGERVGLVSFGRGEEEEWFDAENTLIPNDGNGIGSGKADVVKRFDDLVGPRRAGGSGGEAEGDGSEEKDLEARAQEYERQMRRALERQADELNWMGRFGFRSS